MDLLPDERKLLHVALTGIFSSHEDLRQWFLMGFTQHLGHISDHKKVPGAVLDVISWAESEDCIEELLTHAEEASQRVQLKAVIAQVRASLRTRQPPKWCQPVDPFEACFVGKRAFLDRSPLRKALRDLHLPEGKRFLVVNGGPLSGKTYTKHLVSFLAHKFKHRYAEIDLRLERHTYFGPAALATAIGKQLKLSFENFPIEQLALDPRWVQELRDWLVGEAANDESRWWIVLDGFDHPDLPPETGQLIEQLLLCMETLMPRVRLVLLSYQKPIPRGIRRQVWPDETANIDRTQLEQFFTHLFTEQEQPLDLVPVLVDKVLAKVTAGHPEWLFDLEDAVEDVAEEHFAKEDA